MFSLPLYRVEENRTLTQMSNNQENIDDDISGQPKRRWNSKDNITILCCSSTTTLLIFGSMPYRFIFFYFMYIFHGYNEYLSSQLKIFSYFRLLRCGEWKNSKCLHDSTYQHIFKCLNHYNFSHIKIKISITWTIIILEGNNYFWLTLTFLCRHIGKGCDRDTYSVQSQRKLCGASPSAIDLLPSPGVGAEWTKPLISDEGHESDQMFEFDGKYRVIRPVIFKKVFYILAMKFVLFLWITAGDKNLTDIKIVWID